MNFVAPILHHAVIRPNAPAIIMPGGIIHYAQLEVLSHSIATHLLNAGIGAGDAVVIGTSGKADSILVCLALARIGAVGVVWSTGFSAEAMRRWAAHLGCKAVCRSGSDPGIEGLTSLVLDGSWVSKPARPGPSPPLQSDHTSVARIVFSSGTTGVAKAIAWTHGAFAQRIIANQFGVPAVAGDRLLLKANVTDGFAFIKCLVHLYAGGAVVAAKVDSFLDLVDTVDRYAINHAAMSTFDLNHLLEAAPSDLRGVVALSTVSFAGAALPATAWRKAAQLVQGQVLSQYGATEVGAVALGDLALLDRYPDAVGRLLPWVRMEAVDNDDRPLPAGERGILRIRTPGMVTGYADDPASSARSFRQGWFYPGDIGAVTSEGIVQVVGRVDDLMNLEGVKIAPSLVENAVISASGVRYVGVTALRESDGSHSVGVGVVANGPLNREELLARCRTVVPSQFGVHLVEMDEIPRNAAGKVLRIQLAAQILAARSEQSVNLPLSP